MSPTERGAATMVVLAVVGVAALLGIGLARLGAATVLEARAQSAADAAALAAADQLALGHGPAAAGRAAATVAGQNDARLLHCMCDPLGAEVEVEISGVPALTLPRAVRARARAEVDLTRAPREQAQAP
ncbi:MAG: Rv3654c family TadE-like protein [Actinomycetota bacterium]